MESGKLDLDSGEMNSSKEPVATYKPLPEDDLRVQINSNEKPAMGKQNGESDPDDGAQERMLKDERKIGVNKDATEVKFVSENGDAKIDIETVKQTLAGMGKEELMKYANDPFWIRLRWFLFVAFWLLWLSMLAGAIAIIVMAPKCSAPKPKKWWEQSPIIQLDASDVASKNLKGLESLLDPLKSQNIKAISLKSIVKSSPEGHTEDFRDIQPQLGHISDLKEFVKAAKEKEQHVVLELDPNHSSIHHPWFNKSVQREDNYTDYYVWFDGKIDSDGKRVPPNNWLSVYGGSAWEWNEERGQFYLHQFNKTQPDLNYNNPKVVSEFSDILNHWLSLGIEGFRLANTQYLTEDPNLHEESRAPQSAHTNDYESLVHAYTRDRPENSNILRKWRDLVLNNTKGEGLFTLCDDIEVDILQVFNENRTLIDLPQSPQFHAAINSNISAASLNESISQWLNSSSWPGWNLNTLRQRHDPAVADSLILAMLLLPGTPILQLNDTLSAKDAFTILTNARAGHPFLHGDTVISILNEDVLVYTRLKSGNPGYLVAYHSGEKPTNIDLSVLPQVSEEVNVVTQSPNYVQDHFPIQTKLPSNKVPISPKSTLIVTFVPKT
ncbi:maltase 1 isoform X2 [Cephus cinctus]|uniref:alpha-glucosidase n=1 Tax=Cephus cinctus TaxID=211228 RepID=A0AAJ7BPF8_CEPCN|nr:maltase 1 isoform X2 [Cephus cinctus]